jgi:hypothetical protein
MPTKQTKIDNHDIQGKQNSDALAIMKQSDQNAVRLGVTIADKRIQMGSDKRDKEGNPLIDHNTGEPMKFPDTFYVTVAFNGGSIETKVSQEQYENLIDGARYNARGRFLPVKSYGKVETMPVFNQFVFLYAADEF